MSDVGCLKIHDNHQNKNLNLKFKKKSFIFFHLSEVMGAAAGTTQTSLSPPTSAFPRKIFSQAS